MELPVDNRPLQARFTAPVEARIVADNGTKCMNFEAGESKMVHRDLYTAAISSGLVPDDPNELLPVEEKKVVEIKDESGENKSQDVLIREGLVEACKLLIAKGDTKDFTVIGLPRAASLKNLVDFEFTAKNAQDAFEQAMHEVGADGNSSKESSEPVSDTAQ